MDPQKPQHAGCTVRSTDYVTSGSLNCCNTILIHRLVFQLIRKKHIDNLSFPALKVSQRCFLVRKGGTQGVIQETRQVLSVECLQLSAVQGKWLSPLSLDQ